MSLLVTIAPGPVILSFQSLETHVYCLIFIDQLFCWLPCSYKSTSAEEWLWFLTMELTV